MQFSGYGTMIVLGLLTAGMLGWHMTRRAGLDFNDFLLLVVYTVALGVVGAKAAYLALNWSDIDLGRLTEPGYLDMLLSGGFVFYGGIPLGLLGMWLAHRLHHIDPRPYLRLGMPLLPLAHAFGRVGCFLAGCCYGVPYDGPLAVTYPPNALGTPAGISLFPVQLAEAAVELAIFALLLWLYLRGWGANGLFSVYLLIYGVARFGLEYLRYDAARGHFLWFSTSQWVSLALVPGVSLGWLVTRLGKRVVNTRKFT